MHQECFLHRQMHLATENAFKQYDYPAELHGILEMLYS